MFSRGNHDDQKAPAQVLATSTYQIPLLSAGVYLSPIDPLSAHHSHLESLLDSALATLTLIHDCAPTTAPPALTGHTAEVLRALCRHAFVQAPSPIAPTATPIPSPSPSPTPPATYAQAATGTAADPVSSADAHTRRHSPPPTQPLKARAPDLIFRLDYLSLSPSTRPTPNRLFIDIKEKSIAGDLWLAGIHWTRKGNLTLAFHHDKNFTAEKAMSRAFVIWKFIRLMLGLPKHYVPRVDCGDSWHNIVIHSVPVAGDVVADGGSIQEAALQGVQSRLRESGVVDDINEVSCAVTQV